jgi:hypothetical protein
MFCGFNQLSKIDCGVCVEQINAKKKFSPFLLQVG